MKLETSIYDNLPATTESGNVVIHKVYQRKGVEYARSIGGAFTLRVRDMDKHFGNPYSHVRALCEKDNLVLTATTKDAVIMFIHISNSECKCTTNTSSILNTFTLVYFVNNYIARLCSSWQLVINTCF